MDEVSRKAIERIDAELTSLLKSALEAPPCVDTPPGPRIIRRYKPPRGNRLRDRMFPPCAVLTRIQGVKMIATLCGLGLLLWAAQIDTESLHTASTQQTHAIHNTAPDDQPFRPTRFDLYEPVEPPKPHSL